MRIRRLVAFPGVVFRQAVSEVSNLKLKVEVQEERDKERREGGRWRKGGETGISYKLLPATILHNE